MSLCTSPCNSQTFGLLSLHFAVQLSDLRSSVFAFRRATHRPSVCFVAGFALYCWIEELCFPQVQSKVLLFSNARLIAKTKKTARLEMYHLRTNSTNILIRGTTWFTANAAPHGLRFMKDLLRLVQMTDSLLKKTLFQFTALKCYSP